MFNELLYKTDDGAALRFYEEADQNNHASEKHGRPIFDQCLYVEVITPGSRESAPVFLCERQYAEEVGITEPYRGPKYEEYRRQIDAYRNGTTGVNIAGTPLQAWPRMTVAMVATAAAAGIFTVEGLAELPDGNLHKFGPGARGLREQAVAFVEAAKGNAPAEALAAENVELRADIERLRADIERLGAAQIAQQQQPATATPPAPPPPPPAQPAPTGKKASQQGGNTAAII